MTKTTPLILTFFILALFALSYFGSVQADKRQLESVRSVILFDVSTVEKRHNKVPYTIKEGVFFDIITNRQFTAEIDPTLYASFLTNNKKSINMQRSFNLDIIESTPSIGSAYRIISAVLFLIALITLVDGLFINRKLVAPATH
jgi:hypothetical protein